jgi:hypothetical protein
MLVYSRALLYAVSFTMAWAVVTPAILGLAARFSLLVHTCGMLATAKVTKVAWVFSTLPYFPPPPYQQPQRSTNSGRWHTLDYRERHEDSRLRASQLEARLAMA